jgi:hypothetical protein
LAPYFCHGGKLLKDDLILNYLVNPACNLACSLYP